MVTVFPDVAAVIVSGVTGTEILPSTVLIPFKTLMTLIDLSVPVVQEHDLVSVNVSVPLH